MVSLAAASVGAAVISLATIVGAAGSLIGCGFPPPPGLANNPDGGTNSSLDAPPPPDAIIRVSPSGDDSNDGMSQPVKTLKHAIALAGANPKISTIAMAAGNYTAATGESFPYTVPANVTIVGLASGGTILGGTSSDTGLVVNTGAVQDLELDGFMVAITSTGTTNVTNVHVNNSLLALDGETTAKLNVNNLAVTGSVTSCGAGIQLKGSASLVAQTLTTRNLTMAATVADSSTANVSGADIACDPRCGGGGFSISTSQTFALNDGVIAACSGGLSVSGPGQVTISNTTLQNLQTAINGSAGAQFKMVGGSVSQNSGTIAIDLRAGSWSFTGVKMQSNTNLALYIQAIGNGPATLTMRSCTITNNSSGIAILMSPGTAGDLGNSTEPGNNVFQNNANTGLSVEGIPAAVTVDAVGNTWNPDVQGADATGRYQTATLMGPIATAAGNNFDVANGLSLFR